MKTLGGKLCLIVLAFGLSVSAAAQFGPRPPNIRGIWDPVVGSGSVYQMESSREGKMEIEYAVVGAETVAGKPGHWLEMSMKGEQGQMVMKTLMVAEGTSLQAKRMIMQQGGDGPIELPIEMMAMGGPQGGQRQNQSLDIRKEAEVVGTESITVPAGTFSCTHLRTKDGSDVWVAEKVAPYGLVKMTSKSGNMVLMKVLTDAKTKIKGTPQRLDPEMMRQRP